MYVSLGTTNTSPYGLTLPRSNNYSNYSANAGSGWIRDEYKFEQMQKGNWKNQSNGQGTGFLENPG